MDIIKIISHHREEIIDLTPDIRSLIKKRGFSSGIVTVYSPHTTGAVTVNENADPDVKRDMNKFLRALVPRRSDFSHIEGNSDAHIKGSLIGFSQTFIVDGGELKLGAWQGIFFLEFDGPRNREVWIKFV